MLKITSLVKRYGGGDPVLKDLDLEVPGEEVVSVAGIADQGEEDTEA